MTKIGHPHHCTCCSDKTSRREFIKKALVTGTALSSMGPLVAGVSEEGDVKSFFNSQALVKGKAKPITILYTADIHAQLHTHDEFFYEGGKAVYKKRGGFSVLKSMLDTLKAENPSNTLLIDAGDCFQGGGVAALSEGQAIVPLMNAIGYDLVLPGNWEVVYGKAMMEKNMGSYGAAKICANMFHDLGNGQTGESLFQPYWTKTLAGIKLGFIGYNDPLTPKRQSPAYSRGIKFTKPEENVEKYVRHLRDVEKCSMVFLVTHLGLTQQLDLANRPQVEGVNYILGADTHERVREPLRGKYALVTEPGAFGSFVARLDFIVEKGEIKDQRYQLLDVDPDRYRPDKGMEKLVEKARAPYKAQLDQVIGRTKTTLVRYYVIENPMDNLVTDALMWKFNPDIALSNGFRFCPPLVPDPAKGYAEITNDFLWSMLPVDSDAKRSSVTGKQLWDWMEKELHNVFADNASERFGGWVVRFKGMEVNFTAGQGRGKRINSIKVKGEPIDLLKSYTVVACERDGDPEDVLCRIDNVSNPQPLGITLHTVMRSYLSEFSPVSPAVEGRIVATDVGHDLLSQLEGYDYQFR